MIGASVCRQCLNSPYDCGRTHNLPVYTRGSGWWAAGCVYLGSPRWRRGPSSSLRPSPRWGCSRPGSPGRSTAGPGSGGTREWETLKTRTKKLKTEVWILTHWGNLETAIALAAVLFFLLYHMVFLLRKKVHSQSQLLNQDEHVNLQFQENSANGSRRGRSCDRKLPWIVMSSCLLVGPPASSRLKYFNNSWMIFH